MASDRGPTVFAVTLIIVVLATVFVILRFISKWGVTKKINTDDWLVLVGWVFTIALGVSVLMGTRNGLGKHDKDIPSLTLEPLKRALYAFTIFYNPSLMATKSAILLLYLRMATAQPFLRIASWFVFAIVNISGTVLTFLNIFQCRPVSAAFTEEEGKCIDLISLYLSSAPVNVLTDIAILLLPLPILTALRMEFRQKLVLIATFVVGGFVAIVDVIRIVYLQNALRIEREASGSDTEDEGRPPDFFYEASFTLMWSVVEVAVGLICACVLVLKPLVMKVMPSMLRRQLTPRTHQPVFELTKSPRSPGQRLAPVFEDGLPVPESLPGASVSSGRVSGEDDESLDFAQMLAMDDPPSTLNIRPTQVTLEQPAIRRPSRKSSIFRKDRFTSESSQRQQQQQQHPTQTFFDFVEMGGKKPLTELTAKEAWWPILFVSLLFFLWGFAYGLLGTLNGEIQKLMGYNPARSIALHSAYWIGYFFSPLLIGHWTLTRHSFKSTFIAGLVLYAIGALSFWPSSVLLSYPGFFISNFIIASGLACLEVAGNPFIALAGPSHLSESRLNFSQAIQAVGSVFSPILARQVLFKNLSQDSLFNVQWCYLAVSFLVIALAVVFYYVPLSEAPDDILEATSQQSLFDVGLDASASLPLFGRQISARTWLMVIGVVTMAIYVGAQETISYFFSPVSSAIYPPIDPFWVQAIAHAVFFLGRAIAALITYLGVPPRYVLFVCILGSFVTSLLSLLLRPGSNTLGAFILISFFESAIFPTLFAITLRNQGGRTKLVSTVLVMAISGGAVFPGVAYGAMKAHKSNTRFTLVVVSVLYGVSLIMPGWLFGGMKSWVDPVRPKKVSNGQSLGIEGGVEGGGRGEEHNTEGGEGRSGSEAGMSDFKRDIGHVEVRPRGEG